MTIRRGVVGLGKSLFYGGALFVMVMFFVLAFIYGIPGNTPLHWVLVGLGLVLACVLVTFAGARILVKFGGFK